MYKTIEWPMRILCAGLFFFWAVERVCAALYIISPGTSIQETILASAQGDTILLQDGEYTETVVLYGKDVTVASSMLLDGDSLHRDHTVVTASPSRPDTQSCFVYAYGETLAGKLYGLTLQDGRGTRESIGDNLEGGGVFVTRGVTLEFCRVRACSATYGGGISLIDTLEGITSYGIIRDCIFELCAAANEGGAIRGNHADITISRCQFIENSATTFGGALVVVEAAVRMDSCLIRGNQAQGGAVVWADNVGYITNSVFEENGLAEGGTTSQLFIQGDQSYVSRCVIRNSVSDGISVFISVTGNRAPRFAGNVVEDNISTQITGTIGVFGGSEGDIAYNLIRNNRNVGGGAVYCTDGSRVRIHHNWFEGNSSDNSTRGSVLFVFGDTHPILDSNVITGNDGPVVSWLSAPPTHPLIFAQYNWWGNASGPYHPTLNPGGSGDSIAQDSIRFIPWLTEPPDTTMPTSAEDREHAPSLSTWRLVALYPNPFNSQFTVSVAGFTGDQFAITLYDLLGREVARIHHGPLTGGTISYVARPELASGVYLVRFADQHFTETRKVVFLK